MPKHRLLTLVTHAVLILTIAPLTGCDERQTLNEALKERQAAWMPRAAWLQHPDDLASMRKTLTEALEAADASVPPLAFNRVAQMLASYEADGRLELEDNQPERIVLTGPGSPRRAVEVLAIIGKIAPGIVVDEAKFESEGWSARGHLIKPPGPIAAPHPVTLSPVGTAMPWNQSIVDEIKSLDEKIKAADQTLGFAPADLDEKKLALARFVGAFESPARLPVWMSWIESRGEKIARASFAFSGNQVDIDVTLAIENPDMRTVADFLDGGLETDALKIDGNHITATLRPMRPL